MEEYEVHCNPEVMEPRTFKFSVYADAVEEAGRLCREHHTNARVLRVIGYYVSEPRWISNGVPGH